MEKNSLCSLPPKCIASTVTCPQAAFTKAVAQKIAPGRLAYSSEFRVPSPEPLTLALGWGPGICIFDNKPTQGSHGLQRAPGESGVPREDTAGCRVASPSALLPLGASNSPSGRMTFVPQMAMVCGP